MMSELSSIDSNDISRRQRLVLSEFGAIENHATIYDEREYQRPALIYKLE